MNNNSATTPAIEEYGDMVQDERPKDDHEEAIHKYLHTELILDVGTNNERHGRVVKRTRGHDGNPIGRAHANPFFDTQVYDIEFTDGTVKNTKQISLQRRRVPGAGGNS